MKRLTVERLFSDPPISGALPGSPKISPAGDCVAFLRIGADDRERMDLWRYDIETGKARCWIDARSLLDNSADLTEAEKAERERRRQFSTGITQFQFAPNGQRLLIPANGAGYLLDVGNDALQPFTPVDTRQTDFRFSATGRFVSYVRGNNLYCFELDTNTERAITVDGSELIASGIADFIAQEEMHRFDGHWWSPDDSAIAFTRVDESSVAVSRRYEIDAEDFAVIEQRYPYAGARNAKVQLKVFDFDTELTRDVDFQHDPEDYLARVAWADTSLAVQVQARDQRTLHLDFHDASGNRRTGLTETATTWINLHDNFRAIDRDRFLWTAQSDDGAHLYLYSNGEPQQLTRGRGRVNQVHYANAQQIIFSGWFDEPTEQHLYRLPISGGAPERLTSTAGWHDCAVDRAGQLSLERRSSLSEPGTLILRDLASNNSKTVSAQPLETDHPYHAYLEAHCEPELGVLEGPDGQALHYRLTKPQDPAQPCPCIVHVYGGPGVQRVRNEWPPMTLQLLAQAGYGVLELDNRGSSNRDRRFEAPIYRGLGRVEVEDQLTGARFAQSLDWVDAQRIGIFGHSYGGYMALMCLAQAPETFKAGVAIAPVSDWSLYDTHYTERYLSTPQDNPQGYEASAVFPYLDGLSGRLLLIHGMADDNVLFTHTTKLLKALQQRNVQFELMTYPGSKHALQEREVAIHRFTLILDFFDRCL